MGRSRFTFLALKFSSVIALSACAGTVRSADTAPADATTAITGKDQDKGSLEELSEQSPTEPASRKTAAEPSAPAEASSPETAAPAAAATGSRARPELMQAPVEVEGFWMNAVYFPRSAAETWQTVSQKLYGRPDRATLLKQWNRGARVRVGEPVYYNSPSRPDDTQAIKVFAEDFGYKLEEFKVSKGDSLSKIGEMKLGDLRTWKELSALNPKITNPDVIEVGQVIRMQPREVDTAPVLQNIIKEVTKSQDEKAQPENAGQVAQNTQSDQLPAPAPAVQAPTPQTAAVGQVTQNDQTPPASPDAADAKPAAPVSLGKNSSDNSTSNLLGLGGALMLVTAVGMVIYRRLVKFRATKSRIQ